MSKLTARLERERDGLVRNLITIETTRRRIVEAEEALTAAAYTIRSLSEVLTAARREMAGTADAALEARLDDAERAVGERAQAVAAQVAVNRQALMTLDLILTNESTLQSALNDARTATVSALRLAEAARDASSTAMFLSESEPRESGSGAVGALTSWNQARQAIREAIAKARSIDASLM